MSDFILTKNNIEVLGLSDDTQKFSGGVVAKLALRITDLEAENEALNARIAELEAENKRLKEIAAFSRHSHDCEEFDGWDCTCGYAKALKGGE